MPGACFSWMADGLISIFGISPRYKGQRNGTKFRLSDTNRRSKIGYLMGWDGAAAAWNMEHGRDETKGGSKGDGGGAGSADLDLSVSRESERGCENCGADLDIPGKRIIYPIVHPPPHSHPLHPSTSTSISTTTE